MVCNVGSIPATGSMRGSLLRSSNKGETMADIATFYSVEALADAAQVSKNGPMSGIGSSDCEWAGGTFAGAIQKCRLGWMTDLQETLDLVESAVSTVEKDLPSTHFHTEYGVEGCDVDVDRFLAGEPESMISYPLAETPRVGRVITLDASICYSASFSSEQIKARGRLICALVLALSRMGLTTELWAEAGCGHGGDSAVRVLVKGANDVLDESKIMFMYAHPSALRHIMFSAAASIPNIQSHGGAGYWANRVRDCIEDLPEGTIYLPGISSDRHQDPEKALRDLLEQIGITESHG